MIRKRVKNNAGISMQILINVKCRGMNTNESVSLSIHSSNGLKHRKDSLLETDPDPAHFLPAAGGRDPRRRPGPGRNRTSA